jgi:hypothetical protein
VCSLVARHAHRRRIPFVHRSDFELSTPMQVPFWFR